MLGDEGETRGDGSHEHTKVCGRVLSMRLMAIIGCLACAAACATANRKPPAGLTDGAPRWVASGSHTPQLRKALLTSRLRELEAEHLGGLERAARDLTQTFELQRSNARARLVAPARYYPVAALAELRQRRDRYLNALSQYARAIEYLPPSRKTLLYQLFIYADLVRLAMGRPPVIHAWTDGVVMQWDDPLTVVEKSTRFRPIPFASWAVNGCRPRRSFVSGPLVWGCYVLMTPVAIVALAVDLLTFPTGYWWWGHVERSPRAPPPHPRLSDLTRKLHRLRSAFSLDDVRRLAGSAGIWGFEQSLPPPLPTFEDPLVTGPPPPSSLPAP